MPSERDELLERVYSRANGLWWRRRFAPLAAGVVVLTLAIGVPVLRAGGHGSRPTKLATQPDETTSTVRYGVDAPGEPATTSTSAGATTTTLHCRNSTNPACGPFRWDPPPQANQALVFDVTHEPVAPTVGDTVVFTVRAVDPDASPIVECAGDNPTGRFGDEEIRLSACPMRSCSWDRYGPWTPPAGKRGEATFTYRHVYDRAGTFSVYFGFDAAPSGLCGENPFADETQKYFSIVVTDAPSTTG